MDTQTNNYGKRSQSQPDAPSNGGVKRRNPTDEKELNGIGPDDTVFRYLCPARKIGSIIGVGGDIAKQLRAETNAKIRISETIPGCEERAVTIYSTSDETNSFGDDDDDLVAPAQHALFLVHDRIVAEEPPMEDEFGEPLQVTVRLLVPSDQIGCVLGRGGQIIQNIRSETNAQIRVLSSEHLPPCALSSDEIVQITGEANIVKKALYQVASRLHYNPSRTQHLLLSSTSIHRSGNAFMSPNAGSPYMPVSSLMGPYGSYKLDSGDRSDFVKEFSLRLVCAAENIGAVIGKGGTVIKQIRQESGAYIKVDVSGSEGDDCIIFVSSKESPDDVSRTIDATMRLQSRCSEKTEKESGDLVITTRILVPSSQIGCLIGKGGAIISEMRRATRASIRILAEDNLPKVASADDEMVQIVGDSNTASAALLQVLMRLRANQFEMDGFVAAAPPAIPYLPVSLDSPSGPKYGNRSDNRSRGRGYSTHSSRYESSDYPPTDRYNSYSDSQIGVSSNHGPYGIYSSSQSTRSALHSQKPPYEKSYGY
ncbi:hypothetical protein Leryth_021411 [Lithospermum erythrorhizon]|nr:hypothetical protein Leryth_021411 [Lithospermum erythrorhizon]